MAIQDHLLMTPVDCNCDKRDAYLQRCPVCDWGLAVCKICGRTESELDEACSNPTPAPSAPAGGAKETQ